MDLVSQWLTVAAQQEYDTNYNMENYNMKKMMAGTLIAIGAALAITLVYGYATGMNDGTAALIHASSDAAAKQECLKRGYSYMQRLDQQQVLCRSAIENDAPLIRLTK